MTAGHAFILFGATVIVVVGVRLAPRRVRCGVSALAAGWAGSEAEPVVTRPAGAVIVHDDGDRAEGAHCGYFFDAAVAMVVGVCWLVAVLVGAM
jgi:hypothetical protein